MSLVWKLLLAVLCGTMNFLSFPTFDIYPLAWVFLIPLLWAIRDATPKQAFYLGWVAGFTTHIGGFYWITGLLVDFGKFPLWVAFPLCAALCIYQGLRHAVFAWLVCKYDNKVPVPKLWLAPAIWVAVEFVVLHLFPSYLANSQYKFYTIIQICEITGVHGLSFLLVLSSTTLFALLEAVIDKKPLPLKSAAVTALLVLLAVGFGMLRIKQVDQQMADAKKMKIMLVEADIGIFEKEAKGYPPHLRAKLLRHNLIRHQKLAAAGVKKHKPELIVMSESAYQTFSAPVYVGKGKRKRFVLADLVVPRDATHIYQSNVPLPNAEVFPDDVHEDIANRVHKKDYWAMQRGFKTPILFGAITGYYSRKRKDWITWNTALLADEKGKILGSYDKTYLLMGGEYLPFGDTFPILYKWVPAASRFEAGTSVEPIKFRGHNLGIMICYEDVIPAFTRKLAGKKPEVLINVTNDAWFGKTSEPYLHLALSVFRAVENRLWLVRSTNTGVSAFIDAVGRIKSQTSLDEEEVLAESVPMLKSQTIYRTFGDYFAWLSLALFLLMTAFYFKDRKRLNAGGSSPAPRGSGPKKGKKSSTSKAAASKKSSAGAARKKAAPKASGKKSAKPKAEGGGKPGPARKKKDGKRSTKK